MEQSPKQESEENKEIRPKKKYAIGGHVIYDMGKDLPIGYPKGYLIEASSQEEAEKIAKETCENEAQGIGDGFVHDFWAQELSEEEAKEKFGSNENK